MQKIFAFLMCCMSFSGTAGITIHVPDVICDGKKIFFPVDVDTPHNSYLVKIKAVDTTGKFHFLPVESVSFQDKQVELHFYSMQYDFKKIEIVTDGIKIVKECKKNTS